MSLSLRAVDLLHAEFAGKAHLEDRLLHSIAVGRKVHALLPERSREERDVARALGILHDIGYARPVTGFHPLDGAATLIGTEFEPLAPQVAWHSTARHEAAARGILIPFPEPEDERLRAALWIADFTTSPAGLPVTTTSRVRDIRERYPQDSPVIAALDAALGDLAEADMIMRSETLRSAG